MSGAVNLSNRFPTFPFLLRAKIFMQQNENFMPLNRSAWGVFYTVVTSFKQGKVKGKKRPGVNETCGIIAGLLFGVAHF